MKIILANEIELSPINIMGEKRTVQGAQRDVLSFIFPVDTSMDELDRLFTEKNCETIKIVNGDKEYIHNSYTIRTELKREPIEVAKATDAANSIYENRVIVSMGQRTYMETQIAQMQASMNALLNGEV